MAVVVDVCYQLKTNHLNSDFTTHTTSEEDEERKKKKTKLGKGCATLQLSKMLMKGILK